MRRSLTHVTTGRDLLTYATRPLRWTDHNLYKGVIVVDNCNHVGANSHNVGTGQYAVQTIIHQGCKLKFYPQKSKYLAKILD